MVKHLQNNGLAFQGFFAFLVAYAIFLVLAWKIDPRYSLKYTRIPSFYRLLGISTLETTVLLLVLAVLNFSFGQNLIVMFALDRLFFSGEQILWGLVVGVLSILVCLFVDMFTSFLRKELWPTFRSEREEKVKQLMFSSLPKSKRTMFALLLLTSLKAAVFEEIIFRGYFLSNLLLITHPTIAITVQAFFFFIPHLYQGPFNAILPFILGLIMGMAFYLTGSLTIVMISHFAGDAVGLIIQAIVITKKK